MKISELAIANDLVCRRAELAASFAALDPLAGRIHANAAALGNVSGNRS